jgi:hypothetical protein
VTLRTLHLVSGVAWLSFAGAAAAAGAADAALLKLRQGGEVSCQATEPFFCENVHVRCGGRTSVRTFQFALRSAAGSVELVTATQEFQRRYENANVEWDKDGTYVLLRPKATNGYVKLLADGKYIFRHYIQSLGVMSLGHCR